MHRDNRQERMKYFRGLKLLNKASGNYSKYVENNRNMFHKRDQFSKNWGKFIWFEIKAWQSGQYDEDYDVWLLSKRKEEVPRALEKVLNLHFDLEQHSSGLLNHQCREESTCQFKHCLEKLTRSYLFSVNLAFNQVGVVLDELQSVENLYAKTSDLAADHELYRSAQFQSKLSNLCVWYNTCSKLMSTLKSFLNLLGISSFDSLLLSKRDDQQLLTDHSQICCCISRAIKQKTESYLRKHNVHYILILFINKYFTTLVNTKPVFIKQATAQQQQKRCENVLKMTIGERSFHRTDPLDVDYNLPQLDVMYTSLCALTLDMLGWCLRLRLHEAITCQPNCQSPSSMLTVQQVVVECKEVISCSLKTADILSFLISGVDGNKIIYMNLSRFKADLLKMFSIYLDFTQLLLIRQLTGLPCLPRGFVDRLQQEWAFSKKTARSIDQAPVMCTCKYILICREAIESTEHFMQTALNAVLTSTLATSNLNDEKDVTNEMSTGHSSCMNSPIISQHQHHASCLTNRSMSAPISTEAGMLWFHRQRMEKPFFARSLDKLAATGTSSSGTSIPSKVDVTPTQQHQPSTRTHSEGSYNFPPLHSLLHQQAPTLQQQRYEQVDEGSEPDATATSCGGGGDKRRHLFELSRAIRDLFDEVRERSMRTLNFAKLLRKDVESAVLFSLLTSPGSTKDDGDGDEGCGEVAVKKNRSSRRRSKKSQHRRLNLMKVMEEQGYVRVDATDKESEDSSNEISMFASASFFKTSESQNNKKLNNWLVEFCGKILHDEADESCDVTHNDDEHHVVFVKTDHVTGPWTGSRAVVGSRDEVMGKLELRHHHVTVVYRSGWNLGQKRNKLLKTFHNLLKMEMAQCTVVKEFVPVMHHLKTSILSLCVSVCALVKQVAVHLQEEVRTDGSGDNTAATSTEHVQLRTEVGRVAQKNFNFTFECVKEATKMFSGPFRLEIEQLHMELAQNWMDYIIKYVSRGKGVKPRWSHLGLSFVTSISMDVVNSISCSKYDKLKRNIQQFIEHLIGTRSTLPHPRTAGGECSHAKEASQQHHQTQASQHVVSIYRSISGDPDAAAGAMQMETAASYGSDTFLAATTSTAPPDGSFTASAAPPSGDDEEVSPMQQIRTSLRSRDQQDDMRRQESGIIGRVVEHQRHVTLLPGGRASVGFKWQRGTKLGEGSFGQVYTCVNLETGKILAMKQVEFQQSSNQQKIKDVIDEISTFEQISHENLVKYFGVEIHRDQIYMFMEYCDAGTLEEIGNLGLPMAHIQDYTAQLIAAVHVLHDHGIIHRDIKGRNIFLTSGGLLKLGDFGSAIRLTNKSYTMPGEISSHSGITAAYTAPEVINNAEKRGYGRAADVWSIGCVVIEMASGKRPWYDHEPFQIMYMVGMGSKPQIPGCLFDEGRSFVDHCLQINPDHRWRVDQLQQHPFVRVARRR